MLPEGAHSRETDATVFYLRPPAQAGASAAGAELGSPQSQPPLLCVNVVRTRLSIERRRGADVKALAVAARCEDAWLVQLLPLLLAALDDFYAQPSADTAADLLRRLNAAAATACAAMGAPRSATQRRLLRGLLPGAQSWGRVPGWSATPAGLPTPALAAEVQAELHAAVTLSWAGQASGNSGDNSPPPRELTLTLPRYIEPGVAHAASVASLVRRFGADGMAIFNAVLLEKRLLFLGVKGASAADVAACVLATAHLVCPPLHAVVAPRTGGVGSADVAPCPSGSAGGLASRLFPYANLNDLAFLQRKG
jgi:hypothetical protein